MRTHHNDNRRSAANDNALIDDDGFRANARKRIRRSERRDAIARKSEWLAC
jgi:hypothetical protein